jgi:lipid-A-disaccharide synthase
MGLPGVICYKTSSITYLIAKNLIKLPYIGLINIVLGKQLYPELIQHQFTPDTIAEVLKSVLGNKDTFTKELRNLRSLLRPSSGSTARRVANELLAD